MGMTQIKKAQQQYSSETNDVGSSPSISIFFPC